MPKSKIRDEPRIPDHEVLRQIGGGAYGSVWLARGVTGAMRAAKVVDRDDFEDEREFEREFQGILKYEPISREHPGLVHILHVGRSEGENAFYYYVMELGDDVETGNEINPVEYEARTLRSDMKAAEGEPLDTDFCITTGRILSQGLQHLHGHGLAHRDVKPANVIFIDGKAKLADIGLVALRGQRTFVGTEGFVPPEGPGSAQADVYSLGKVLYEMATGKDRMEFPELPDELPGGDELKRWRSLNSVICDICEPRISQRKLKTAEALAEELGFLEAGESRPMQVQPVWALLVLCLTLVLAGGWNFLMVGPWDVRSGEDVISPFAPVPTELALVTIQSEPSGADVFSEEGELLGQTPLIPRKMPVDTWVSFEFRLRGFQTTTAGGVVSDGGLVIEPTLKIDAPPQIGENWEDVLGMSYRWENDAHVSHYYVGEHEWRQYLSETAGKKGIYAQISENGRQRSVVFANKEEAKTYVKWLTERCRDGYLNEDQILKPRMDRQRALAAVFPKGVPKGKFPFRCVALQGARIQLTSEPEGADVYINGVLRGPTPLRGRVLEEEVAQYEGIRVLSGKVVISLEADGFKTLEKAFTLQPNDYWEEPEHFVLEKNTGVVFGRTWEKNSLGMRFEPDGEDLMVAVWETRVADYAEYVKLARPAVFAPQAPDFPQDGSHPVVNVSREDANAFCQWLTKVEQERDLISKTHEYRLPTDLEWSRMAGLADELFDWPQERDRIATGFPWGGAWPPLAEAGNFADEAADNLAIGLTIPGYVDRFAETAPVGSYEPNGLGLQDLSGNVYEWVGDDYYKPRGMSLADVYGVLRGGCWNSFRKEDLMTSARFAKRPTARYDWVGFRVVLAKVPVKAENPALEPLAPVEEP